VVEDVFAVPCSNSTAIDRSEPRHAREVKPTDDIKEFCEKLVLKDDVAKTLSLARQHFSVLGDPWYEIIKDSESQECYLAIHINADGSPDEIFEQSESFLDAFVTNFNSDHQRHISLVHHSTSAR
jgi:hypothetical protein